MRTGLFTRLILGAVALSTVACGNGGAINFDPGYIARTTKGPGFNMVSGSQALVIENGKTVYNGVHGKVQLNEVSGTTLKSGVITAKLKYTTRNR